MGLQLKANAKATRQHALAALQQANQGVKRDYRLDLISLALKGKKVSFDKVLKMVDDMVALLKKEQQDDNDKKEYCEKMIDKTEDNLKALELSVSDLGKAIADYKESIATLTEEIEGLEDGIKALDKQVAEATEERKEEHKESAKADLEGTLVASKEEKAAKTKEAMATAQYLSEVHGDCDWLLSNFQVRKEARAGEIDSLKKAKAVLSGADYSLLQSAQIRRHA